MMRNRNIETGIPSILLMALRDCARTTRIGLIDRGSPDKLGQLAIMGFVVQKNGGHIVTSEGFEYLSEHRREVMKL